MMFFTTLCLFSFVLSALASPVELRDVWDPPVTSPAQGVVWTVGEKQTVTWDTSNPPQSITNPKGTILLGYEANDSLNLDVGHPLAKNFELADGKVTITVPDVPARTNYFIVLLGSSDNKSPEFRIIPASLPSQSIVITEPIPITGPNVSLPSEVPDTSVPASASSAPPQPSPAPNPSSPGQPSPPAPSPSSPINPSSSPSPTASNSNPNPSQSGNSNAAVHDQVVARGALAVGSLLTLFMLF